MNATKNIVAGVAGALVLNILHETARRLSPAAPRIQLVGEEALSKSLKTVNIDPPKGNKLFGLTLATDLLSNAAYFSMVGSGSDGKFLVRGLGYGLAAGVGALTLTKPMGLNDAPVNRSLPTQLMTVAWYTIGGLTAAFVAQKISEKPQLQQLVSKFSL